MTNIHILVFMEINFSLCYSGDYKGFKLRSNSIANKPLIINAFIPENIIPFAVVHSVSITGTQNLFTYLFRPTKLKVDLNRYFTSRLIHMKLIVCSRKLKDRHNKHYSSNTTTVVFLFYFFCIEEKRLLTCFETR